MLTSPKDRFRTYAEYASIPTQEVAIPVQLATLEAAQVGFRHDWAVAADHMTGVVAVVAAGDPGLVAELGYVDMFNDMFGAMDEGRAPMETFYDGYVVNSIIDACYRSAESRRCLTTTVPRPTRGGTWRRW